MTREQLAKVFPDGRTVHLPTDGKPLAGFALAQADIEKRASSPSTFEAARIAANETRKPANPLAKLFGFKPKADDEDDSETRRRPRPRRRSPMRHRAARDNIFAGLLPTKPEAEAEPAPAAAPAPQHRRKSGCRRRDSGSEIAALRRRLPQVAAAPAGARRSRPPAPTRSPAFARRYLLRPRLLAGSAGHAAGPAANRQVAPPMPPPARSVRSQRLRAMAKASRARRRSPMRARRRAGSPAAPKAGAAAIPRPAAVAANTTIASKARPNAPTEVHLGAGLCRNCVNGSCARLEGPWIRALIMTPSVARFMNTTLYGIQDYRSLQPLLQTPTETVLMAFGADAQSGPVAYALRRPGDRVPRHRDLPVAQRRGVAVTRRHRRATGSIRSQVPERDARIIARVRTVRSYAFSIPSACI